MPLTWNVDWLNLNAQRAYPLSEQATGTDLSGSMTLPNSFIVGMQLSIRAATELNPQLFRLLSVVLSPVGYAITVGYDDVPAATMSMAVATHAENNTYALVGIDEFDECVGSVTIGDLTDIAGLAPGHYFFDETGGKLDPDIIKPQLRGLSSVRIVNGTEESEKIYGDIELVAGANVRFDIIKNEDEPTQIVLNAISGEGLNNSCDCDNAVDTTPIITINGIPPDGNGNFRLTGESCVDVSPISNGLLITNSCASPCCGCRELDALNIQLDLLSNNVTTMENFQSRLSGEVSQMSMVVLGSRLGDVACGN